MCGLTDTKALQFQSF